MKIRRIESNNRKHEFTVITHAGEEYPFPYSEADPAPRPDDRLKEVFVDDELGNEAFTYVLESGAEGTVHIDHVLEYNEEPEYLADLLTYKLSLAAKERLENSELSRRQVARRLNTSVPQLYRLVDPSNMNKSMKQLVALLHVLGCDVDLVVKQNDAA